MSNKTKLPDEAVKEIKDAAKAYTHSEVKGMVDGADINPGHIKYAYEEGATAYATKLHEAQQEVKRLTNWQREAQAILKPIWDYADTIKVPLGESNTEAVIKHIKDAKDLLRRLRSITTWLDMPDTSAELRNEIDDFLK